MSINQVNAIHIFLIGPLLIYIGLMKPINELYYNILLGIGIVVIIKFIYQLIVSKVGQRTVWYLLHIMLFSVLSIYVGLNKINTPHIGYSLVLATGISAFGYHSIRALGW
jgi:hypothetical protein